MIGEVIDHYRVLELIGRGAMGVVYKALDVNLDRLVAIKVMSAEVRSTPDFVERFRQEARLQGALNHPNVALLFDYFIQDGAPVAVMEFIEGESLEQMIHRRGAIPAHEGIPIFKQALRGVAAAHSAGIIHRDLKPANLMITKDGVVKVMDFGIAKRQGTTGATKASTSIGSPLYMAPEQILGRTIDRRTDVYALGTTLYELLSGHPPFNPLGKSEFVVLNAHVNDLPEPPTVYRRGIPKPIVDAVMRALAKEPDARFQSVDEFMCALPDVPAPNANAIAPRPAPSSTSVPQPEAGAPRVGPTGTLVVGPKSDAAVGPTGTLVLGPKSDAAVGPTGTLVLGPKSDAAVDPIGTVWFQPPTPVTTSGSTSAAALERVPPPAATAPPTVDLEVAPAGPHVATTLSATASAAPSTTQELPARPSRLKRLFGVEYPVVLAALVATLVLGPLIRHALRHATLPEAARAPHSYDLTPAQPSSATQMPPSQEPVAPPPAIAPAPSADAAAASVVAVATDLSGTWRGEYVDALGRQLLRVVSLSIVRVHNDGGIEGTLQYEAASGGGECKLHPRGSTYWASEQRLQLSPESCSPHHPKELGVPLDFADVNPRANALKDGRIEAPTGEVITVKLERVGGV